MTDFKPDFPVNDTDIAGADTVEILIRNDGTVVWINVDGVCRLRVCRITGSVIVKDDRPLAYRRRTWE